MPAARSPKPKPGSASSRIHAILGTDEGRVKEVAQALARELAPPGDEFGLEIVSGQADNSDHASQIIGQTLEAIQTLPFFGGDKVVWLQGATFFGDSVTGRSQTTLSAVERLQAELERGMPPGVTFILSASEMDKRRGFYKKLAQLAQVQPFDRADISKLGWETRISGQVSQWAREAGFSFERGMAERFILMVGPDTRMLRSELEKLALYLGERRQAGPADLQAIVGANHAGIIFAIGDALGRRNLPLALELIERQLHNGESPVALLLAAIVPRVRQMFYLRDLVERHGLEISRDYRQFERALARLPAAETAHLPKKKDGAPNVWGLFATAEDAAAFTAAELRRGLEACLEANLRLVTTGMDPRLVLSQLVTRILSSRQIARKRRAA